MKKTILISVACYNNEDEIVSFGAHLSEQKTTNEIVYVITLNSCKNRSKLTALENLPLKSAIITPPENLGYLHGCLYGIRTYSENVAYDWALISNTDITFLDKSYLEQLFDRDYDPDVWCLGTKVMLATTGKNQNPFALARPSKFKMRIRKLFFSNMLFYNIYFKLSKLMASIKRNQREYAGGEVYAVHGSIFAVHRDLVTALIHNADKIFMYGEEILIAELVLENEKKVLYTPSISANHNENQVTGKITTSRKQKWFLNSTKYLVERFWNYKR